MAGEERTVAYEVHVLKRGRWEIHASYPEEQKRIAVRDAKSLDRISTIEGVKVIKDTYITAQGTSKDEVIYLSPSMVQVEQQRRNEETNAAAAQSRSYDDDDAGLGQAAAAVLGPDSRKGWERDARKTKGKSGKAGVRDGVGVALFFKLVLITLVSLLISGIVVALASMVIKDSSSLAGSLSSDARANLLFALFIIIFLISAFPLALRYLGREQARAKVLRAQRQVPFLTPTPAEMDPDPVPEEDEADAFEDKPKPEVDARVLYTMRTRLSDALRGHITLEAQTYFDRVPKPEELLPPDVRTVAGDMLSFLRTVMKLADQGNAKLDNVTRFGISLFMAGAAEHLGRARGLGDAGISRLLSHSVQSMGFRKMQADSFALKCDQYLLADARYMQMYSQGRTAMEAFGHADQRDPAILVRALEEWNKPKVDDDQAPKLVAILFTDIVGSTGMTQSQGDQGAQELLRLHNQIVRSAILAQKGREIKHTGDGIMASFSSISGSVDAACEIQKRLKEHGEKHPDKPLAVRIGINAGEPIAEEDDLFGTPVQLASRITDRADAGQVFVSDTMRGLCAGKTFKFVARGTFRPKGIPDDVALWEVIWDESAALPAEMPEAKETAAEPEPEIKGSGGKDVILETAVDPGADPTDTAPTDTAAPTDPAPAKAQEAAVAGTAARNGNGAAAEPDLEISASKVAETSDQSKSSS